MKTPGISGASAKISRCPTWKNAARIKEADQKFGGGLTDARRIVNLTDGSEKPLGQWNTLEIECKGAEVIVHVNGTLVNHGSNCTVTSGKIALQAEGAEVEFRKVELTQLAKD